LKRPERRGAMEQSLCAAMTDRHRPCPRRPAPHPQPPRQVLSVGAARRRSESLGAICRGCAAPPCTCTRAAPPPPPPLRPRPPHLLSRPRRTRTRRARCRRLWQQRQEERLRRPPPLRRSSDGLACTLGMASCVAHVSSASTAGAGSPSRARRAARWAKAPRAQAARRPPRQPWLRQLLRQLLRPHRWTVEAPRPSSAVANSSWCAGATCAQACAHGFEKTSSSRLVRSAN